MIEFALTQHQQELVSRARDDAAALRLGAAHADRTRTFPLSSMHALRRHFELLIPNASKTQPSMTNYALVMSELAKGDASAALGLCMHHFAMGELRRDSIPFETRKLYWELGREHLFSALVSEPGSSNSQVASFIPTDLKATRKNNSWILNGKKHFGSFFALSDYSMVFAHLEGTPSTTVCLMVPTKKVRGIKVDDMWHMHGMRATMSNPVSFTNVELGPEAFIFETTDYLQAAVLEGGARTFGYMAVYLGIGERLLELAAQNLSQRVAKGFTQALGYDPSVAEAIGSCHAKLHASRLTLLDAMSRFDLTGSNPDPETLRRTFVAKQVIGHTVDEVAQVLRLRMGAHGLLTVESSASKDGGEFERLLRDAATAGIMPPSTTSCQRELGYMMMGFNDPSQRPSLK